MPRRAIRPPASRDDARRAFAPLVPLGAAVLAAHVVVLDALAPDPARAPGRRGEAHAAAPTMRRLEIVALASPAAVGPRGGPADGATADDGVPAARRAAGATTATAAVTAPAVATVARPTPPATTRSPRPTPRPPLAPFVDASRVAHSDASAAPSPSRHPAPSVTVPAFGEHGDGGNDGSVASPPVPDAATLPAAPPPAATLRWRVDDRGRAGHARLDWRPQPDGAYALALAVQLDARAAPALEQRSDGRLDGGGLRPARFVDRRGGRAARAATFVDDAPETTEAVGGRDDASASAPGRRTVAFSAREARHDAPAGSQDRLSALVQLVALHRTGAVPPVAFDQTVVDAAGFATRWRWRRQPAPPDAGASAPWHWQREPEHADGVRVEVWLDPDAGHWPRRMRYSFLRRGDAVEYTLEGIDAPAAPAPAAGLAPTAPEMSSASDPATLSRPTTVPHASSRPGT